MHARWKIGGNCGRSCKTALGSVGYIQLCDAPTHGTGDYLTEAMFERNVPGEGELPLPNYLAALPRDVRIGLEIPLRSRLLAGEDAHTRLSRCVDAARAMIGGTS